MGHVSAVTFDTVCLILFVSCVFSFRLSPFVLCFPSVSNFYFTSQYHQFPPSLLLLHLLHPTSFPPFSTITNTSTNNNTTNTTTTDTTTTHNTTTDTNTITTPAAAAATTTTSSSSSSSRRDSTEIPPKTRKT